MDFQRGPPTELDAIGNDGRWVEVHSANIILGTFFSIKCRWTKDPRSSSYSYEHIRRWSAGGGAFSHASSSTQAGIALRLNITERDIISL
jgi:hypothetical protein